MEKPKLFKRLFAHTIDRIVNVLIFSILFSISGKFFLSILLSILIYSIIQLIMWSKGTSIGKKLLGLYIVDIDTGNKLSLFLIWIRETMGKYISGFLFCLGYIWILIDKNNQGFHDKLVSSVVVEKYNN